jgi:hypothetical protein
MLNPVYLPVPQHLNWNQTRIYQSSSFPPVASEGPPEVDPIVINLPNDIAVNELIGITVVASRGTDSSWNPATDTIQWNCIQIEGGGAFDYELGSGCITNLPNTNNWLQNLYSVSSYATQQNWFYFEALPNPIESRQVILWCTGTPTAGTGGSIEVWLSRQQ